MPEDRPVVLPDSTARAAAEGPAGELAVRAEGLRLGYGARLALHTQRLDVPAGQITAIIGPNGSGKSSLLDAISGLLRPATGGIEVFGAPVTSRPGGIAYVLQHTDTDTVTPLTAREVVRMGRYPARGLLRRLTAEDHRAVETALQRLGIADLARRQLAELSGGQRQRVFVAQALVQHAPLILLDEPMTALDLPSQDRIREALAAECRAGRTIVYTTHSVATAGEADWAVLLAGTVIAAGTPETVLTPASLRQAYGDRLSTDPAAMLLDDPHPHDSTRDHTRT